MKRQDDTQKRAERIKRARLATQGQRERQAQQMPVQQVQTQQAEIKVNEELQTRFKEVLDANSPKLNLDGYDLSDDDPQNIVAFAEAYPHITSFTLCHYEDCDLPALEGRTLGGIREDQVESLFSHFKDMTKISRLEFSLKKNDNRMWDFRSGEVVKAEVVEVIATFLAADQRLTHFYLKAPISQAGIKAIAGAMENNMTLESLRLCMQKNSESEKILTELQAHRNAASECAEAQAQALVYDSVEAKPMLHDFHSRIPSREVRSLIASYNLIPKLKLN